MLHMQAFELLYDCRLMDHLGKHKNAVCEETVTMSQKQREPRAMPCCNTARLRLVVYTTTVVL